MRLLPTLLLCTALAGPLAAAEGLPFTAAQAAVIATAAHQAVQPGKDGKVTVTLADGTEVTFMAAETNGVIALSPVDAAASAGISAITFAVSVDAAGAVSVSAVTVRGASGTVTASVANGQYSGQQAQASNGPAPAAPADGTFGGNDGGGGALPAPLSISTGGGSVGKPGGSQANQGGTVSTTTP